ncbi:hypothetical protein KIPB_011143, partial [Kipferlia bialata]|eukprot:g11143.t1
MLPQYLFFSMTLPMESVLAERLSLFEELYAAKQEELSHLERTPIEVTLPDGNVINGTAHETTPLSIAEGISKGLAKATVCARINGETLVHVLEPLKASCTIELLKFDSAEGKEVFWHASGHILGYAMESLFGAYMGVGHVDEGFSYDAVLFDNKAVLPADLAKIEQ